MNLADDLLAQARRLAKQEPRRPKQASLRRAISTAYYALFHLLVQETAQLVVGRGKDAALLPLVGRALEHSEMRKVSAAFRHGSVGSLPEVLRPLFTAPFPTDLADVADAFSALQKARHEADYNLAPKYSRSEAEALVESAETAFAAWRRVRGTFEARVFLLSFLFLSRWNR
jgi:uncharacterized protein (UPF0332 family)